MSPLRQSLTTPAANSAPSTPAKISAHDTGVFFAAHWKTDKPLKIMIFLPDISWHDLRNTLFMDVITTVHKTKGKNGIR